MKKNQEKNNKNLGKEKNISGSFQMEKESAIIKELRKSLISDKKIEPKEGQRELLRSSKNSLRCPSLCYEQVEGGEENINRAFDLLFEAILEIKD